MTQALLLMKIYNHRFLAVAILGVALVLGFEMTDPNQGSKGNLLAASIREQYSNSVSLYFLHALVFTLVPIILGMIAQNTRYLHRGLYLIATLLIAAAFSFPLFLHFHSPKFPSITSAPAGHPSGAFSLVATVLITAFGIALYNEYDHQDWNVLVTLYLLLLPTILVFSYNFFPKSWTTASSNRIIYLIIAGINGAVLVYYGIDSVKEFFRSPVDFLKLAHLTHLTSALFYDYLVTALAAVMYVVSGS